MRVMVDPSRCQGHALCALNVPEVFDLDDEGHARVLADPVPNGMSAAARAAEGGCPEQAIVVEPQPHPRGEEGRA
jgi:ferredoxin